MAKFILFTFFQISQNDSSEFRVPRANQFDVFKEPENVKSTSQNSAVSRNYPILFFML